MVYMVGALRQLGAPLKGTTLQAAMNNMQQRVYRPPNVAGWEGGMSWLNTNTVLGRWDLITRVQYLKYSQLLHGHGGAARSTSSARRRRRPSTARTRPSTARGSRPGRATACMAYATTAHGDADQHDGGHELPPAADLHPADR